MKERTQRSEDNGLNVDPDYMSTLLDKYDMVLSTLEEKTENLIELKTVLEKLREVVHPYGDVFDHLNISQDQEKNWKLLMAEARRIILYIREEYYKRFPHQNFYTGYYAQRADEARMGSVYPDHESEYEGSSLDSLSEEDLDNYLDENVE